MSIRLVSVRGKKSGPSYPQKSAFGMDLAYIKNSWFRCNKSAPFPLYHRKKNRAIQLFAGLGFY